jgi:hypothetical protein
MSHSSILGGDRAPQQAPGRDAESLGPSDTSDSGSDIRGAGRMNAADTQEGQFGATPVERESDTDSMGTGERAEAVPEGARDGADIAPDRIARSKDALDSAESITDNDDTIESLADDGGDEQLEESGEAEDE